MWIAAGRSGTILRSTDGVNWDLIAWPEEFPPSRIHSSVDGLTWTTSDIAVGVPEEYPVMADEVRWNGAQYVLLGWRHYDQTSHLFARSCNGRVWGPEPPVLGLRPPCGLASRPAG